MPDGFHHGKHTIGCCKTWYVKVGNLLTVTFLIPLTNETISMKPSRTLLEIFPEKFHFVQDEVEFAGFEITNDTVRPCKRYIRAIADFPHHRASQTYALGSGWSTRYHYAFSMADAMLPFWELLKPSKSFHWDETLQNTFDQSKLTIINEIHN